MDNWLAVWLTGWLNGLFDMIVCLYITVSSGFAAIDVGGKDR